jgi:hypothetical protein
LDSCDIVWSVFSRYIVNSASRFATWAFIKENDFLRGVVGVFYSRISGDDLFFP